MTGLDLEVDSLVEIAVVVTDSELNPLDRSTPRDEALARIGGGMDPFVVNMHTSTGLINEWDGGLEMASAEKTGSGIRQEIRSEGRKAPLGGNSVGTDRTFLARDMPKLC